MLRRDFLKAGLAAATLTTACNDSTLLGAGPLPDQTLVPGKPVPRPDFLVILTDQSRNPQHWPEGWVQQNMPAFDRLQRNGLTFQNAYIAASQCSPSRACLLTGQYSKVNGVPLVDGVMRTPAEGLPNIATMLTQAGYDVIYKGKWHLSHPVDGAGSWSEADIENLFQTYGMAEWNPPDAGTVAGAPNCEASALISQMGGGIPNNDGRFVHGVDPGAVCPPGQPPGTGCQTPGFGESVLDFLARVGPPGQRKPFCLFVSLANPHDIGYFRESFFCPNAGYPSPVPDLGIEIPANAADPLTTKPSIQTTLQSTLSPQLGTPEFQVPCVNFYAYLHTVVDALVGEVLDALEANGLTENTIIFRTADHGEQAVSHGLLDKAYNAYQETINVPLIVSNPKLYPEPRSTDALWSHIDLAPTLAALAGAEPIGTGVDQSAVLKGTAASARTAALFAFDDSFNDISLQACASHIRALRTRQYTYAVYFTETTGAPFEFELYDNLVDPLQLVNLLHQPLGGPPLPSGVLTLWEQLHAQLVQEMTATNSFPEGFEWPANPVAVAVPTPPPKPDKGPCLQ